MSVAAVGASPPESSSGSADPRAPRVEREVAYTSGRSDVVGAVLAHGPASVLDVGCSSGALAAGLRAASPAALEIVGIELDPELGERAADVVDELIAGDAVAGLAQLAKAGRTFDAIIFADVLEHLVDPWACLDAATGLLSPGGIVAISVPNVAHWQTTKNLVLHKRWPRRERGIFDATHLRWFAENDVRELVSGAGLELVDLHRKPRIADQPSARINRASKLAVRLWPTGFTYQFLVTARGQNTDAN